MKDPNFAYSDNDFDESGKFIFPELPEFKPETDKHGNILNLKEFREYNSIEGKRENLVTFSVYDGRDELWQNFDRLSPVQQKAIRLFITGVTIRDISRECEVSEGTLYRWLQLDIFITTIKLWQQRLLIETDNRLKKITEKALEKLEYVLDNPTKFEGKEYLRAIEISLGFLSRGSK